MARDNTEMSVQCNRNFCAGRGPFPSFKTENVMDSLGTRIAARREELGMSQEALAEAVGMSQQGIFSIESGQSKRPRKLHEIALALEVYADWLLHGTGPKVLSRADFEASVRIPVLGEVAAGLWLEIDSAPSEPREWLPFIPVLGYAKDATFALRVRGNSIDKIAPDGAYVVCTSLPETGADFRHNELVVVERLRQQEGLREVTVKRVRRTDDGIELHPESTDPRWKPFRLEEDNGTEVRVIARVEWIANRPQ